MDISDSNDEVLNEEQSIEEEEENTEEDEIDPTIWEQVGEENVVLNIVGLVGNDFLKTCDPSRVKLIGLLDSEHPVLQIDRFVFVGKREQAPGTCVLFKVEKNEEGSTSDNDELVFPKSEEDQGKIEMKYFCSTTKTMTMEQAFLSNKND